jgi:hypothetical protein
MSRGGVCRETCNGTTVKRAFDEQKRQNQQGDVGIGFGALIAAGVIFLRRSWALVVAGHCGLPNKPFPRPTTRALVG